MKNNKLSPKQEQLKKVLKPIVEGIISEVNFVRTNDVDKYAKECVEQIKKVSSVSSPEDEIKIAEAICESLNRQYIRYKSAIEKYGK